MILYFDEKRKKIIASMDEVTREGLTRLSDEQVAYWTANPRAHWSVIMAAGKAEQPEPYVPSVEELRSQYLKELSNLSLEILGSHVSEYQLVNARLSLDAVDYDKIYDDDKAHDVIDVYLEVGKQCRTLFYEAKSALEACDNIETIKSLRDEYNERYEALRKA